MSIDVKEGIKNTLLIESEAVKNQINSVDLNTLEIIVDKISHLKGKVITTGCGTSAVAAKKITHSLCCVGVTSVFLVPSDGVHGSLGVVNSGDIVIVISKGGNTIELLNLIASLKELGAMIIGVGENPQSSIGEQSDIFVKVTIEKEPDPFNMLATASTLSVISIFDSIAIEVMKQTGYTREQFKIRHPGGAVGQRLVNSTK